MDKFKLVPVEPTEAMLAEIHLLESFTHAALRARYRAMLAAAPAPAFDEAAERAAVKSAWWKLPFGSMNLEYFTAGWLACARMKAEVGHE